MRTRFRAAPECAWAAEVDGDVVGSVFAARWGSFGFLGLLSVHPDLWDRGIGGRLLRPVLDAFASWNVRQAGLFTFADSPRSRGGSGVVATHPDAGGSEVGSEPAAGLSETQQRNHRLGQRAPRTVDVELFDIRLMLPETEGSAS